MSFERRKVRVGTVVSDKMDQTLVVLVERRQTHSLYKKSLVRRTRFFVHDAENICKVGDVIRIIETRPISKTKRWRVAEIVSKGDIADLQPEDIGVEGVLGARTELVGSSSEDGSTLKEDSKVLSVKDSVDEVGMGVSESVPEGDGASNDENGSVKSKPKPKTKTKAVKAPVDENEASGGKIPVEADVSGSEPTAESVESEVKSKTRAKTKVKKTVKSSEKAKDSKSSESTAGSSGPDSGEGELEKQK